MKLWVLGYFLTAAVAACVGYVTAGLLAGNKVMDLYERIEIAEARLRDLTQVLHLVLAGLERGSVPPDTIALARRLADSA